MNARHISLLMAIAALLAPEAFAVGPYDPLAVSGQAQSQVQALDLAVHDEARARDLPLRVYLRSAPDPAPLVLFSHGLGGSREGNAYMGRHWAARGYVVVFVQHPGSDGAVWKDKPPLRRMLAMREAATRALHSAKC